MCVKVVFLGRPLARKSSRPKISSLKNGTFRKNLRGFKDPFQVLEEQQIACLDLPRGVGAREPHFVDLGDLHGRSRG